jgi:NTE family protein
MQLSFQGAEQGMKIALVLGSGSARGWAHIGVIRALQEAGIRPDIVCGASIGALVGAAYSSGTLDSLEEWVRGLDWWDIMRVMDPTLGGGGVLQGDQLMKILGGHFGEQKIQELPLTYGAVATNLRTGQEIWLRHGSLIDAVRASIALPGLFTPTQVDGQLLVDGGLVNPVPVSLARSLGADFVIAVNLNGDIVGRHLLANQAVSDERESTDGTQWEMFLQRLNVGLRESSLGQLVAKKEAPGPGLFDVLASSINIMQDRITRSRLAGDPPEVSLTPRLARLGLLEFDRAAEAIEEGRRTVKRMLPAIKDVLGPRN